MSKIVLSSAVLLLLLLGVIPASAAPCESLASLKLADTTITSAQAVAAGALCPGRWGRTGRWRAIRRSAGVLPHRRDGKTHEGLRHKNGSVDACIQLEWKIRSCR